MDYPPGAGSPGSPPPGLPEFVSVRFYSWGGMIAQPINILRGTIINPPNTPNRPGFRFDGWFTPAGVRWDFSFPVGENLALTARWTALTTSGGNPPDRRGNSDSTPPSLEISGNPLPGISVITAAGAARLAAGAARALGEDIAFVRLIDPGPMPPEVMHAIVSAAGMDVRVLVENLGEDGRGVDVRITFNPALAVFGLNPQASTTSLDAFITRGTFDSFFDNPIYVVSLSQQRTFGQPVRVAARLNPSIDVDSILFFSYDWRTNLFRPILQPNAWVDPQGFVHFTTTLAGEIVLTDSQFSLRS